LSCTPLCNWRKTEIFTYVLDRKDEKSPMYLTDLFLVYAVGVKKMKIIAAQFVKIYKHVTHTLF